MDITSVLVGTAIGVVIGAVLFTPTGRDVSRASGERLARKIRG